MFKSLSLLYFVSMMICINAFPLMERGVDVGSALQEVGKVVGSFTGKATFFKPKEEGGPVGACGPTENNDSKIVALNLHQYGDANKKSDWCFKKVRITYGDKSTDATITDACPGCQEKSLDLTPSVFQKLASFDQGIIDIDWCVLEGENCSGGSQGKSASSSGKNKGKGKA
ncbi:RlpA-like double-psi beta-barrel-protein domain-containing protein-containing protein [Halteromyces radiatus]|uniref:RlpA-like double-psi beta-barrel-protein domain-containing protein-containing protein n=1 Tax=Halteromyces radiatus TaxID=101107 RepID=UPI00221F6F22|nr:RlpA-like double-psi beta-barrel-protein domain-containing protein-containing protein [Halteromyces radiatus]KAI8086037.1 RlpA-like double-psi beta-barrel-protein domain-containing protein-containing protein [Halteromyces radiatus]